VEEISRRGIDFTFGSDAHCANAVGRDIEEASQILREIGVQSIVGFESMKKVRYPLD